MKLIISSHYALPCRTDKFYINDIEAFEGDFGETEIFGGSCIDGKCCATFIPKQPRQDVLDKYNISVYDYLTICNKLMNKLCVRNCGWCG